MQRDPKFKAVDIAGTFRQVQEEMIQRLSTARLLRHSTTIGNAAEQQWLELLRRYLPQRFSAQPVFVVDADGKRSRQIDIAIFDNFQWSPLFPHSAGLHIAAESVYAVFEVKAAFSRLWIEDAALKAASVRTLRRYSGHTRYGRARDILAGILAGGSAWTPASFPDHVAASLETIDPLGRLDLGCSLSHGSFENRDNLQICDADESLGFFVMRLLDRLNTMGPAPRANLSRYARSLRSMNSR